MAVVSDDACATFCIEGRQMKFILAAAALAVCAAVPALADDGVALQRLTLCQDSWLDWQKTDPAKFKTFGNRFRAQFLYQPGQPYFLPKNTVWVAGLRVEQAYPDSVGMGVGFSVTVAAPFDVALKAMEKVLGSPLTKCDAGDGMHMCELDIAQQRTFTVMAEDGEPSKTLIGCYYLYEK
jgi:hypothetical protein